jgi:glutamine phosphoribosylpyrophosphate amidotransferase
VFDERLDKLSEECGVFGVYAPQLDVARLSYYGLFALQHRGQESAGIAVTNGCGIKVHKDTGLVAEVFAEENIPYRAHSGRTCAVFNQWPKSCFGSSTPCMPLSTR